MNVPTERAPLAPLEHLKSAVTIALAPIAAVGVGVLTGSANITRWAVLALIGIAAASAGAYYVRWLRWQRGVETQHIYAALCRVTGDHTGGARERLKVTRWRFGTHTATTVRVRPGQAFADDEQGLARLVQAFGGSTHVPLSQITVRHAKRGWLVLASIGAQPPRPEVPTALEPVEPVGEAAADPERTDAAVKPMSYQPAAAKRAPSGVQMILPGADELVVHDTVGELEDAIRPILDSAAQVEITGWHEMQGESQPAALLITYTAAATATARKARPDVLNVAEEMFPPEPGRFWKVERDSKAREFRLTNLPDPLADPIPLFPQDPNLDLAIGIPMGMTEDGQVWHQPIVGATSAQHTLVIGWSGSGKSSPPWNTIHQLAPFIADGRVRLWIVDPKGGQEFEAAQKYAHRFAVKPREFGRLLAEFRDELDEKLDLLRAQKVVRLIEPTVELPVDVLIVDEIARVAAFGGTAQERNTAVSAMSDAMSVARSAGGFVIGCSVEAEKEVVKMRNLFQSLVALRMPRTMQTMVLPAAARENGALCDTISATTPGVGYVLEDGKPLPLRVRVPYVDQAARAQLESTLPEGEAARWLEDLREEFAREDETPGRRPRKAPAKRTTGTTGPRRSFRPVSVPQSSTVKVSELSEDMRVRFDGDADPVTVVAIVEDPTDEDRAEVTYRYDGESSEKVASCELDATLTLLSEPTNGDLR